MLTLKIEQDTDAMSPADWGDESVFVVARHRDFHVGKEPGDTEGFNRYPLRAYIHSGVALSLGSGGYPFNDPWDSCWVGSVYVKRDDVPDPLAAAQAKVDEWNQYLSGDVWGYVIEDENGEDVDSCWGFYGEDYCREEGESALKREIAWRAEQERKIEEVWAV